ncbi:MAG TPA: biopolymer transporter ExbD [Brevundimonas sp.]|jgi:biopolymer transport protein TolR|uniref:ExbD/TolR family protein n=1 Tax=Brevundimonas sp. TaxID=1871086 RepID=UPI002DE61150|nr:biopolymer transporter ExbD [Brevundimonas sp.]
MALSVGGGGHQRGRRRARKKPLSEINVTPLVDVMLVLLIIFMISAPLLTVAVPVDLPKTEAGAVEAEQEPVVVSIDRAGEVFVGEARIGYDGLIEGVRQAGGSPDKAVSVRADGAAPYSEVAKVMARLSANGYAKLNLITDTAPRAAPAAAPVTATEG